MSVVTNVNTYDGMYEIRIIMQDTNKKQKREQGEQFFVILTACWTNCFKKLGTVVILIDSYDTNNQTACSTPLQTCPPTMTSNEPDDDEMRVSRQTPTPDALIFTCTDI
jgi:hypothetical protein